MKRLPPAVLALLLPVGLVVGFFAGRLSAPGAPGGAPAGFTPRGATPTSPVATADAARPTDGLAAIDRRGPERSSAGTSVAAESERLATRIVADAAAEFASMPTDHALEGQVSDLLGRPFAGADVVVMTIEDAYPAYYGRGRSGQLGLALDERPSALERVRSYARGELDARLRAWTTKSAEDGSFRIDVPAADGYRVQAFATDHDGEALRVGREAFVRLTLGPVGVFHLEPRLPDGTVPEFATVEVVRGERLTTPLPWSREDPILRLPEAAAIFRIGADASGAAPRSTEFARYVSEPTLVDVQADGAGPHVIQLAARAKLSVRVVAEGSMPESWSPWVQVSASGEGNGATLNQSGPFTWVLAGHAEGSYDVRVGRFPGAPEFERTVEVPPDGLELDVRLAAPTRDDFVAVRCLDPDGRMLTDVELECLFTMTAGHAMRASARGVAQPGGELWIPWATFRSDDEVTERWVVAMSSRYGVLVGEVTHAGQTVDLHFAPPSEVTVVLTGEKVDGLTVLFEDDRRFESETIFRFGSPEHMTDRDGRVDLGPVQPGRYRIQVPDTVGRSDSPLLDTHVDVASGPTELALALRGRSVLEVVMPDGASTRSVYLSHSLDGSSQIATVTYDGIVRFEDVLDGAYLLQYRDGGEWQYMRISVPTRSLHFRAEPVVGYELTDTPSLGPFQGTDVRQGDVILGAGAASAGDPGFWKTAHQAVLEGPVTFRVERDGRVHSVNVSAVGDTELARNLWLRTRPRFD